MKLHFPGALFLAAVLAAGVSAQISFNTCVGPPTSDYCGAGGACELPDGSLLCCDGAINCGGNGVCMYIQDEGSALCDCDGICEPGGDNSQCSCGN
ncbi:hypothetical protein CLAIMM_03693 [Cladophialophora immunda]|nr:hypothetical protein CLAIMM_03693 [Cladophialophora immunda]